MSTSEILSLTPENVWKYFYELTKIPRPTGQMEEVTKYVIDFGKSLNLETVQDKVGNVLIKKPATTGYETSKTVILQSHLDMFLKRTQMLFTISLKMLLKHISMAIW